MDDDIWNGTSTDSTESFYAKNCLVISVILDISVYMFDLGSLFQTYTLLWCFFWLAENTPVIQIKLYMDLEVWKDVAAMQVHVYDVLQAKHLAGLMVIADQSVYYNYNV